MHESPIAAVTNCHEPSSLNIHRLIILQFRRSEVQNGASWAKSQVWTGLLSLWRLMQSVISSPFPASRGRLQSVAGGPFLHLQAGSTASSNLSVVLTLPLPLPHLRTLVTISGPRDNPGSPPRLEVVQLVTLVSSATSTPLCHATKHIHRSWELGRAHLWGPLLSRPHTYRLLSTVPGTWEQAQRMAGLGPGPHVTCSSMRPLIKKRGMGRAAAALHVISIK